MDKSARTKKITNKVISGALAGTLLGGAAVPAVASESFHLPVTNSLFKSRNNLLSAVFDDTIAKKIISEGSLSSPVLTDVANILCDKEVTRKIDGIKPLIARYQSSLSVEDLKSVIDANLGIQKYLNNKFPEGFAALQKAYLGALKNHGVMGQRSMPGLNVSQHDNALEQVDRGGDVDRGGWAWTGAYTTAMANVLAVVNVSFYSNVAVVLLVAAVGAIVVP